MENFKREIFEALGYLYYALAADQKIPIMASGELKMLIKKDWLTERDNPSKDKVSEGAHLIGITIDSLQNQKMKAAEAYQYFASFYAKHYEQFSHALKLKILETAESIIKIFPSGQKDTNHFGELRKLFQQSKQSTETQR